MKILTKLLVLCALLGCLTGCGGRENKEQYKTALAMFEAGNYSSALKGFEEIADYKDSDKYIEACKYHTAVSIVSPDSIKEYTGNIVCNSDNISQFQSAVVMLKEIDGYKNSNRILKDATNALEKYNEENRTERLVNSLKGKFVGYIHDCEYDGTNFKIYFSDAYPVTADIVRRGLTETQVTESWISVREMFCAAVFEVFPEATVHLIDRDGVTLGMYVLSESGSGVSELMDIATKPY